MPMVITGTPAKAFDVISFDLHGKMKESKGYYWVLTIIDPLTKWYIAVPLQDATAETVAKALVNNVITEYGCPKALLSDLGTQFQSKLMKAFADMFKIERFKRTAYHPMTQGSIERTHSNLVHFIREFVGEKGN